MSVFAIPNAREARAARILPPVAFEQIRTGFNQAWTGELVYKLHQPVTAGKAKVWNFLASLADLFRTSDLSLGQHTPNGVVATFFKRPVLPKLRFGTGLIQFRDYIERIFYRGFGLSKQKIDSALIKSHVAGLDAQVNGPKSISLPGQRECLKLYSINPAKPIMQDFSFLTGIRSSAFHKLKGMRDFVEAGIPVRLCDYRGFGENYGLNKVSRDTLVEDGKAILADQASRSSELNVVGHSLGTAIGAAALDDLSRTMNIRSGKFVVVSGWNDMQSVCNECPRTSIKVLASLFGGYAQGLFEDAWDTGLHLSRAIKNIAARLEHEPPKGNEKFKVFIVHGMKDDLVSINQAHKLEATLKQTINSLNPKLRNSFEVVFLTIPNAGHFNIVQGEDLPYSEILTMLKTS